MPGWLLLLDTTSCTSVVHGCKSPGHSEANARLANTRFGIPKSAMLRVDVGEGGFDLFGNRSKLLLSCTEPWLPKGHPQRNGLIDRWRAHPQAVTLAHGVDEDAVYVNRVTLDPSQRPERWRDMRSTK